MCGWGVCFLFDKIHTQGLLSPDVKLIRLRETPRSYDCCLIPFGADRNQKHSVSHTKHVDLKKKQPTARIFLRNMFCTFFNAVVIFCEESDRSMATSPTWRDTNSLDTISAIPQSTHRPLIMPVLTVILGLVSRSLMKEELSGLQFHMHFYWCIWTKCSVFLNQCQISYSNHQEGWLKG